MPAPTPPTSAPRARAAKSASPARAERLSRLVKALQDGAVHSASDLARALGVSARTIWRDMDVLRAAGFSLSGTRGAGYRLTPTIQLPALHVTLAELEALHLALAILSEAADADLAQAAAGLASKIDDGLPEQAAMSAPHPRGFSLHPFASPSAAARHIPLLRAAIRERRVLRARLKQADGTRVTRLIHPQSIEYMGKLWRVIFWSVEDTTPMSLRVDQIDSLIDTGAAFGAPPQDG
ncbi:bifunctional biotin--[acetyl-CoA-carboxylase] synthetase/biotin operon repressor [Aquimixticola soesokkakensis]|uniref:Bifunctional biotin--[acetyl-CoA-carboxylase] synthetase/biotin operon repressor n=1 Tax=Aquimixticola soesokkakensis TaxID=1519096 RepID=A0A1Y5S394_9RHOB|nr:HTH domain-containing protein [Aquimixticola soesokkakensis]SLN30247.1 bifunctional biotin--[acetyl-CoA-carboxylase] synthetase/biotin operon repressor [Aquimixticola soesokkakensis]